MHIIRSQNRFVLQTVFGKHYPNFELQIELNSFISWVGKQLKVDLFMLHVSCRTNASCAAVICAMRAGECKSIWLNFKIKREVCVFARLPNAVWVECVIVRIMRYGWRVMHTHYYAHTHTPADYNHHPWPMVNFTNKAQSFECVKYFTHFASTRIFTRPISSLNAPSTFNVCSVLAHTRAASSSFIRQPTITFWMWKVFAKFFVSFVNLRLLACRVYLQAF